MRLTHAPQAGRLRGCRTAEGVQDTTWTQHVHRIASLQVSSHCLKLANEEVQRAQPCKKREASAQRLEPSTCARRTVHRCPVACTHPSRTSDKAGAPLTTGKRGKHRHSIPSVK